jgi:hypothetical protein
MKGIVGALAATLLCGAAGKPPLVGTLEYGIGANSCAHWLNTSVSEHEGSAWLLGFWTGLNNMNPINHYVGEKSDADAIIGEVKIICQKEPSTVMGDALVRVYLKFERTGK